MKKKNNIFDIFKDIISLDDHDSLWYKNPGKMNKLMKKYHGFECKQQWFHPICIQWSEKGRGFGEYLIWQKNGKIIVDSECDSKETVKKMICKMIDEAVFIDNCKSERERNKYCWWK